MMTLKRHADRGRHTHPQMPAGVAAIAEAPSHILRTRVEDLGAAWSAHACRCRQQLPPELVWAAPPLDRDEPVAVLCGHEQVCQLIVWHHHLPTYQQVSFSCQRLTRATRPTGR